MSEIKKYKLEFEEAKRIGLGFGIFGGIVMILGALGLLKYLETWQMGYTLFILSIMFFLIAVDSKSEKTRKNSETTEEEH